MNVHVKVVLTDERNEEFCGPGLLQLLDGIRRTGSIHQAAGEMKLSYVKALKILNRLEKALGHPLLIRHKGGAERGHSTLTPFAVRFTRDYAALRRNIQRNAQRTSKSFVTQYERKQP
jgi:molybdate transport system regulatory protein